jgi:hypothetical protein
MPAKDITIDDPLLRIQVYSPGDYLIHVSSETPSSFPTLTSSNISPKLIFSLLYLSLL